MLPLIFWAPVMTIQFKSESYHICGNQPPASKCWHVNAARTLLPLRESAMATKYRSLTSSVAGGDVCLYFRNKETIFPLGIGSRDFPSGQFRRSIQLGIVFGCTICCNVAGLDSTEAKKSFDLLHEFQIVRHLSLDTAQGTLHVGFLRRKKSQHTITAPLILLIGRGAPFKMAH